MASWEQLTRYVRMKYEIQDESEDELRILYAFEDERTQVVLLRHEPMRNGDDWVQIASPCGDASKVDLMGVLTEIGENSAACGAAVINGYLIVRHALPLANLDFNELDEPLELLANTADIVEETYFGGDSF